MNLAKHLKNYRLFFFVFIPIILFQYKYINDFPSYIHAWAQSDHYALAVGFVNNGFDFFKPETFIYNHQLPNNWMTQDETCITPVDFPINDYIPALLMNLFQTKAPWVFRLYILFYSIIGLLFLYKIGYKFTKSSFFSLALILFAATSPVYVYYQAGFLPTIPALSNVLIGYYFYLLWVNRKGKSFFVLSVLFLTLAALSRLPFLIYLIAVFCVELFGMIKNKKVVWVSVISFAGGIAVVSGYFLYNHHLFELYGSIFLNKIRPPDSLSDLFNLIIFTAKKWGYGYFSVYQYLILILVAVALVVKLAKKQVSNLQKQWLLLVVFMFLGSTIYALLMLKQFTVHDYYFLDTFFLPSLLLLVVGFKEISSLKRIWSTSFLILFFLISVLMIKEAYSSQRLRRVIHGYDRVYASVDAYRNSDALLTSLGISKQAKILVLYPVAPNIPFLLMDRKGYAIQNTTYKIINDVLKWDFDYIAVANNFLITDVVDEYPDFINCVDKVGGNDKLTVYRLRNTNRKMTSILEFVGLNNKTPVFDKVVSFDSLNDSLLENSFLTDTLFFSPPYCALISKDRKYGEGIKYHISDTLSKNPHYVYIQAKVFAKKKITSNIVISIVRNKKVLLFKPYLLKDFIKHPSQWNNVVILNFLPAMDYSNSTLSVFLWNPTKEQFFYDDLSVSVY